MNKLKKTEGFTLVELIVVITILGILAAVAVPTYSGYITKAKDAADIQILSNINTAAQGLAAGKGATVSNIVVTTDADGVITAVAVTTANPTGAASNDDMLLLVTNGEDAWEDASLKLEGSFKGGAHLTTDGWATGTT